MRALVLSLALVLAPHPLQGMHSMAVAPPAPLWEHTVPVALPVDPNHERHVQGAIWLEVVPQTGVPVAVPSTTPSALCWCSGHPCPIPGRHRVHSTKLSPSGA